MCVGYNGVIPYLFLDSSRHLLGAEAKYVEFNYND